MLRTSRDKPQPNDLVTCITRLAALLPILFLLACSGDDKQTTTPDGPRFLLTGSQGLTSLGLNDQTTILEYPNGTFLLDPAVSEDGKTYAFTRQPPAIRNAAGAVDFGSDLMLLGRDEMEAKELLHHGSVGEFIRNPVFLPGGEALLINVRGRAENGSADFRIERLDLKSGQRTRIIEDAVGPALAPDGKTLAFVAIDPATQDETLTVIDLDTKQRRTLVPSGGPLVLIQNLTWSPDGKTLAFMSSDLSSATAPSGSTTFLAPPPSAATHPTLQDLWVIDADGKNLRRIAELIENAPSGAWSHDSKTIYVMASGGFWSFDVASGTKQTLGPGVAGGQIARFR